MGTSVKLSLFNTAGMKESSPSGLLRAAGLSQCEPSCNAASALVSSFGLSLVKESRSK